MNDKLKHFLVGIIIYGLVFIFSYESRGLVQAANLSLAFAAFAGIGKEGFDKITGLGHADGADAWATVALPLLVTIVINFI